MSKILNQEAHFKFDNKIVTYTTKKSFSFVPNYDYKMINPSIHGWIEKFFVEQNPFHQSDFTDTETFYINARATGFILGHITTFDTNKSIDTKGWRIEEMSKVGLLNTLFQIFRLTKKTNNSDEFIKSAIAFYDHMNPKGYNFFKKVLPTASDAHNLENIIHERVQTNEDIISKNFSHIITNALLFVDVLAYREYLENGAIPDKYLKKIEETIVSIISLSLKTKSSKSQHDDLLIKLFEASVRYSKFSKVSVSNLEDLNLNYFKNNLEKYYFIDLAGMSLWSDGKVENEESYFLYKLAETMKIADKFVDESIHFTDAFIIKHLKNIPYFNYSNPVKHFYDQTTESVVILIGRNKNRLLKEISQSKELMLLLAQSTHRDLDEKEKKKVKTQLLDICKTVPSLTIFLLPGGSLLLPILIKFIPKLLPSAFNENIGD